MKRHLALLALLAVLPLAAAQGSGPGQGSSTLFDIGLVIAAASIVAFVAAGLKQPLIPAYIIAGVIIGPVGSQMLFGSSLVSDPGFVRALSELGITFLLFTVGVELDLSRLKDVGKTAVTVGAAQVALTFGAGFALSSVLGFGALESVYLGLALAFSSTMVVIKIISDTDEIETLHGRIMLGILLIQDVIAIVAIAMLSQQNGALELGIMANAALRALGLFSLALVIGRYAAPRALRWVSKSPELVLMTALSFALLFTASSLMLGLSAEVGGFLGGLSLAVFPYNLEVSSRVKPLRDFFAILFFVSLGMQFYPMGDAASMMIPVAIFSAVVVVLKPAIITLLCLLTGYERRTAFLSGIGLGQVSEFSLIPVMAFAVANPESRILSVTIITAIFTIALTPYMIRYANRLFIPFSGWLEKVENTGFVKKKRKLEQFGAKALSGHVIVFGAHIMGMEVVGTLQRLKRRFVVVDHNPEVVKKLMNRGVECLYGDLEDVEVLERVGIRKCRLVVSTIPNEEDSMLLIKTVKGANPNALVFVTAKTIENAISLYREGADYVIHMKLLGGKEASERLEAALEGGPDWVLKKKLKEIEFLERKRRDELVDRVDKKLIKQLDELKAQEIVEKSEELGEE